MEFFHLQRNWYCLKLIIPEKGRVSGSSAYNVSICGGRRRTRFCRGRSAAKYVTSIGDARDYRPGVTAWRAPCSQNNTVNTINRKRRALSCGLSAYISGCRRGGTKRRRHARGTTWDGLCYVIGAFWQLGSYADCFQIVRSLHGNFGFAPTA